MIDLFVQGLGMALSTVVLIVGGFLNPVIGLGLQSLPSLSFDTHVEAAEANTITVLNKSGSSQANYPFQFGRPFVQGEIRNYPQVLVNGSPVFTQADVKQRYPDGSVKHAIMSVIIPTIPASGSLVLSFRNQSTGNNGGLSTTEMLASDFNFDASMSLTSGGQTKSVSARKMLQDGHYTYWTQGPVATTVVLADHSASRAYDIGFDAYRPFRPVVQATFWPSIDKVQVRFVGEVSNTEELEDVTYDLALKVGSTNPQTVYTKPGLTHYLGTRWTKTFWLGGEPEAKINIDHNLAYLGETKFFPNYDTSVQLSEKTISTNYTTWQGKAKDLYDAGSWLKYMPTTGQTSGPAVGHYPAWTMNWLYSGDWRTREVALTNADLAGAWAFYFREGDPARKYDSGQSVSALGKPISLNARPKIFLFDPRITNTDQLKVVGTRGKSGWVPDGAHQPDAFSPQYILTGDPYYLEGIQMWPATSLTDLNPNYRGTPGRAAIISQTRGEAWLLRNQVNAVFLTPDDQPAIRNYFVEKTNQALAKWEGSRNITGTSFEGNEDWTWGKTKTPVNSPLHSWRVELFDISDLSIFKPNTATHGTSPWMDFFVTLELGIAKEKGFPTDALLTWHALYLTGQFNTPGYNRNIMATYRTPLGTATERYTHWLQVQNIFTEEQIAALDAVNIATNGYAVVGSGAAAMVAEKPGGKVVWDWFKANVRDKRPSPDAYLAWNFLPRSVTSTSLPPTDPLPVPTEPVPTPTPAPAPVPTPSPTPVPTPTPSSEVKTSLEIVSLTGDFTYSTSCGTLTIGKNCSLSIIFTPTSPGVKTGALTLRDVYTGKVRVITLRGVGLERPVATSSIEVPGGSSSAPSPTPSTSAPGVASAPETGLVARYTFDPASISGNTVGDVSGNGNNGTVMGTGVAFLTGKIFGAVDLPGTGYIKIPDSSSIRDFPNNAITLSVWAKTSSPAGEANLFGRFDSKSRGGYGVKYGWWYTAATTTDWHSLNGGFRADNNWHLYTFTWDGAVRVSYRDGVQVATAPTETLRLGNPANFLMIGGDNVYSKTKFFVGSLDDLRIYSRALSASEVKGLYDAASNTAVVDSSDLLASSGDLPVQSFFDRLVSFLKQLWNAFRGLFVETPAAVVLVPSQESISFDDVVVGGNDTEILTLTFTTLEDTPSPTPSPTPTPTPPPPSSEVSTPPPSSSGGGGGGSSSGGRSSGRSRTTTARGGSAESVTVPTIAPFTIVLSRGSNHPDTLRLQQLLISKGLLASDAATGYFGPLTETAVKAYQCSIGILCAGTAFDGYGVLGPRTRAALSGTTAVLPTMTTSTPTPVITTPAISSASILTVGATGTDVTRLQNFLIKKGYLSSTSATGYFGPLTQVALRRYQCDRNIVCTQRLTDGHGLFGPKTRALVQGEGW